VTHWAAADKIGSEPMKSTLPFWWRRVSKTAFLFYTAYIMCFILKLPSLKLFAGPFLINTEVSRRAPTRGPRRLRPAS
jgi:hypothetical protein